MDITSTFGPTYADLATLSTLWNAFTNWFSSDEGNATNTQSSYEATGPHPALVNPDAPLASTARKFGGNCSASFFPPEYIELKYWPIWEKSPWECSYAAAPEKAATTAVKDRGANKTECKHPGIPFEAIEYRYGGTAARNYMHLPWCMNK